MSVHLVAWMRLLNREKSSRRDNRASIERTDGRESQNTIVLDCYSSWTWTEMWTEELRREENRART